MGFQNGHRVIGALAVITALVGASAVRANHSWGGYHWARTANPFTLQLGDNLSVFWDAHLAAASGDWSRSSVLDTVIAPGRTKPGSCRPTGGRVEVCNERYGKNGWLGIASIWVSGSHITQATVRMNDTYFSTQRYNTPAWRQMVLCQEVGHVFGLDHQDENFSNPPLGTCMDYTSDPTPNQHPNQHDYDQLAAIYGHADSFTSLRSFQISSAGDIDADKPSEWGALKKDSRKGKERGSLYERDLGNGERLFTFVIWADQDGADDEGNRGE